MIKGFVKKTDDVKQFSVFSVTYKNGVGMSNTAPRAVPGSISAAPPLLFSRKYFEMQMYDHDIIVITLHHLWLIFKSQSFASFYTSMIGIRLLATHQCVLLRPADVNITGRKFKLIIN